MSFLRDFAMFTVNIVTALWDGLWHREDGREWERFRAEYPDAVPRDDWS